MSKPTQYMNYHTVIECDIPQLTEPSHDEKSSDDKHEISKMKICHREFCTLCLADTLAARTQLVRWATIYDYDAYLITLNTGSPC